MHGLASSGLVPEHFPKRSILPSTLRWQFCSCLSAVVFEFSIRLCEQEVWDFYYVPV